MRMDTRVCLELQLLAVLENAFCNAPLATISKQISYTQAQSSEFDKLQNFPKYQKSGFAGVCGSLRIFAFFFFFFFFFFFVAGCFGRRKLSNGIQEPILNLSARD